MAQQILNKKSGNNSFMTRLNVEEHDFYPTPDYATEALLERECFEGGVIWECACGDGAISKILKARGLQVFSTDLIDRGYGEVRNLDFIQELPAIYKAKHIITNPPFKIAKPFIEQALKMTSGKVAMLLRLAFLESADRYELFKNTPLKTVYVFSKRLTMSAKGEGAKKGGMIPFAWFIWEHGYEGKPYIEWIL